MRKPTYKQKTLIAHNDSFEGKTIEEELRIIKSNNEPIGQVMPLAYTDRKDGVLPGYDIRADKMEIAREAKEKIGEFKTSEWAKGNFVPEVDVTESKYQEILAKRGKKTVTNNDSNTTESAG